MKGALQPPTACRRHPVEAARVAPGSRPSRWLGARVPMSTSTGNVTHGPANAPLEHCDVLVDPTGHVVVDADTTVDAATRTAV